MYACYFYREHIYQPAGWYQQAEIHCSQITATTINNGKSNICKNKIFASQPSEMEMKKEHQGGKKMKEMEKEREREKNNSGKSKKTNEKKWISCTYVGIIKCS